MEFRYESSEGKGTMAMERFGSAALGLLVFVLLLTLLPLADLF